MKSIYFTPHAIQQMRDRNTNIVEVETAIQKGKWVHAEHRRLTTSMTLEVINHEIDL